VAGPTVSKPLQQLLEVQQRPKGNPGSTQRHACARRRIQHPRCNSRHDTGRDLYVNDDPASALLAVEPPDRAAVQRMPPVVDCDFLPDMGRMSGDWPWGARTGCSLDRCGRASGLPLS
jgi:hypothetical protein